MILPLIFKIEKWNDIVERAMNISKGKVLILTDRLRKLPGNMKRISQNPGMAREEGGKSNGTTLAYQSKSVGWPLFASTLFGQVISCNLLGFICCRRRGCGGLGRWGVAGAG